MKHFAIWLFKRIWRSIITFPNKHFKWYKHGIYYETGIFLFYTLCRYVITFIVVVGVGIGINAMFNIRSDNPTLAILVLLFVYYTIEFISVIISIQYDKYCSELQKTMDALKRKEQSYTEEEAYYNNLAQHTFTGSANTGVGYQALNIKPAQFNYHTAAQSVDPERERKLAQLEQYINQVNQHHNIRR